MPARSRPTFASAFDACSWGRTALNIFDKIVTTESVDLLVNLQVSGSDQRQIAQKATPALSVDAHLVGLPITCRACVRSGCPQPVACWFACSMTKIRSLASSSGGGVAIVSGLVVALMTERRGRNEWRRQNRLSSGLQGGSGRSARSIARSPTLAISDERTIDGTSDVWVPFHAASVEWNPARHEASADRATGPSCSLLAQLDRELDHVLEAVILKRWDPSDFRGLQRARLGELASQYVRAARATANDGDADLPSIWSWASDLDEAARRPELPATGGDPESS